MSKAIQQPHQFPKRILLAVNGMSPAIVTETLYSLAVNQQQTFVPTDIHIITTLAGAGAVREQLLEPNTSKIKALCQDYNLGSIEFSEKNIYIITDKQGNALNDIKTPEQNEAAADFITDIVNRLTRDEAAALHVSIAGGRKTMGYYLGYALSLYGRKQDELSHVLVTDIKYEHSRKFFYPTPYSNKLYDKEGSEFDARDAEVIMAKIPFVRLRRGLPEELLNGDVSFSASVESAQQDDTEPLLVLKDMPFLYVNDIAIKLAPTDYLTYRWVLQRSLAGGLISRKETEANAQSFAIFYEQFTYKNFQEYSAHTSFKCSETLASGETVIYAPQMSGNWLSDRMNGIKATFQKALGTHIAKDYILQKSGEYGNLFYNIALTAEQVQGLHYSQGKDHDSHTKNQFSR